MRPAENIERLIKNLTDRTSAQMDERVLGDVLRALEESKKNKSAASKPNIRRTIMKSPITKLAAAAVIIIACFTGLFLWKSTGSGIALADVLTRIEQVTAYMYQMRSTITGQQTSKDLISTVLISQENGIKITTKTVDPNNGEHPHGCLRDLQVLRRSRQLRPRRQHRRLPESRRRDDSTRPIGLNPLFSKWNL